MGSRHVVISGATCCSDRPSLNNDVTRSPWMNAVSFHDLHSSVSCDSSDASLYGRALEFLGLVASKSAITADVEDKHHAAHRGLALGFYVGTRKKDSYQYRS